MGVSVQRKSKHARAMQALEQLFHARRILGYSYVFAFYMFGNDMFRDEVSPAQNAVNQNLFEDQQQQLEGEVRPYTVNGRSPMKTWSSVWPAQTHNTSWAAQTDAHRHTGHSSAFHEAQHKH